MPADAAEVPRLHGVGHGIPWSSIPYRESLGFAAGLQTRNHADSEEQSGRCCKPEGLSAHTRFQH